MRKARKSLKIQDWRGRPDISWDDTGAIQIRVSPPKRKTHLWVCLSFWDFSTFDRAASNILGAPCLRPVRDPKIRVRCFDEGGTEAD